MIKDLDLIGPSLHPSLDFSGVVHSQVIQNYKHLPIRVMNLTRICAVIPFLNSIKRALLLVSDRRDHVHTHSFSR